MLPAQNQRRRKNKTGDPVYPVLNMYSCPRVSKQRVNNARIPLLKYRERIYANNHSKSYENDFIQASLLRKFEEKDGLIHSFKQINKKVPQIQRIKVLICVCMYNESKNAINLTLNGIYSNLANLRAQGLSDGDIGVVLIQDGILKLVQNRVKRTYVKGENSMVQFYKKMDEEEGKDKCDLIERINVILDQIDNFDRKGMKGNVARNRDFPPSIQKNVALVYQNLWRPSKTHFDREVTARDSVQRLRLFSCFKHTNGTKLSSHLWFFQGFCRYLKPEYCVLLDVGTTPDPMGIVNLIKGFSAGKDIGGCTGFMSVDSEFPSQEGQEVKQQNCLQKYCFSIERAQQYEYIISHFLDKNAESALGFLHVLPGAWSAYRYDALIKSDKYEPNLLERSYFKMILNPDLEQKDFQEANMYLAQDRILSLGIYCQMQSQNLLKYVPDAIAYTDPMKDHENLMNQRRRWINSSFFAFFYVFKNYYFNVMDSEHNFFRKYITLNISMFMALFSTITSYLTPAFYFFILYSTIIQLQKPVKDQDTDLCYKDYTKTGQPIKCLQYNLASQWAAKIVSLIYVLIFLVAVGGALTGRQWSKRAHVVSAVLSFYTFAMVALVFYNIVTVYLKAETGNLNFDSPLVVIILTLTALNLGLMVIVYIIHIPTHCKFVWKLIADQISYMAYTGAYSQTMVIHSFCNVDDVSWGTKGSVGSGGKKYEVDKVFFVSSWLFYNALLSYIFLYIDIVLVESDDPNATGQEGGVVLLIIAFWVTISLVFKALFAIYYHFKWLLFEKCCLKLMPEEERDERKNRIDAYWKEEFKKQREGEVNLFEPSLIIKRKK